MKHRAKLLRSKTAWPSQLLLSLASMGLGALIGTDLRGDSASGLLSPIFWVTLVVTLPLPLAALDALYHHPLHRRLLCWPLPAIEHYRMGLRFFFRGSLHLSLFALSAAVTATASLPPSDRLLLVAFCLSFFSLAAINALGFAGLAAWASDADGEGVSRFRQGMAGPFVSQRHSPYLYFPALAYGTTTFGVSLAVEAIRAHLDTIPLAISPYWLITGPLFLAILLFIFGSRGYARTGLKAIARVAEEARTIYGGKPAPADPPYGWRLAQLLPGAIAPHFKKELREQSRIHRGLWAYTVLVGLVFVGYALEFGRVLNAAPWIAVVLLAWLTTLPTRRRPRDSGEQILLTLPCRPWTRLLGRWLALLFVASHLGSAIVIALFVRHDARHAYVLLALLVASSLWAIALTMGRTLGRRGGATLGWGAAASWLTPIAAAGGIAATIWQTAGVVTIGFIGVAAFVVGLRRA